MQVPEESVDMESSIVFGQGTIRNVTKEDQKATVRFNSRHTPNRHGFASTAVSTGLTKRRPNANHLDERALKQAAAQHRHARLA